MEHPSDERGGHITASLGTDSLVRDIRGDDVVGFIRDSMAVSVDRPSEGLTEEGEGDADV